jgi:hypothetical protein
MMHWLKVLPASRMQLELAEEEMAANEGGPLGNVRTEIASWSVEPVL